MKFGESENSFLHYDKSLVEGMLISFHTEKKYHRCKMKPLHGLNIYFGPVSFKFKCFKIDC